MNDLPARFWATAAAGTLAGALGLLTLFWRDWIEAVFGVDPDNHSGALEWTVVIVLLSVAAACAALARSDWRFAHRLGPEAPASI